MKCKPLTIWGTNKPDGGPLDLKIRPRRKRSAGSVTKSLPLFLLILFVAAVAFYLVTESVLHFTGALPFIGSLAASSQGIYVGGISLGFLSIVVVFILVVLSVTMRVREGISVSWAGAGAAVVTGLLLGMGFTMVPTPQANPWPYSVKYSAQGFTFVVYYNSTTLIIGKNLTVKYVLTDDSYQLVTPYYLFGGQFSMVFFNSTGGQAVAFRAPISFRITSSTVNVELAPGEMWSTILGFNGTIISENGTHSTIKPGGYTLSSYAVLQDANASLYVDLHPSDIHIDITNPTSNG